MLKPTELFFTISLLVLVCSPAFAGNTVLPEPDAGMLALVGSAVTGVVLVVHRKFRNSRRNQE